MTYQPLVSIITPAYNAEKEVAETIDSVLNQTYQNWELIIIDDTSKDNTIAVVEAYSDERIKLVKNAENCGPALTRNNGIEVAKGEFLAFLDSDDLWLPEKLELHIKYMLENDLGLSFTQYKRFVNLDEPGRLIDVPEEVITYNKLLKGNCIYTSTTLLDLRKTGVLKMKDTYYDDYALWLELAKKKVKIKGFKKDLMRYRVREGSVSRNKLKSALKVWEAFRDVEKLPFFKRTWYFFFWGVHNVLKYRSF